MKTDLNGNDERDIKAEDIDVYSEKMSDGFLRRVGNFISGHRLYFAIAIILFISFYGMNIGGLRDSIQKFFGDIHTGLSYILFQTAFIRGVAELLMSIGSYIASKRTRSDIIKKITQIVFVALLLLAIYDIYPTLKYIFGG